MRAGLVSPRFVSLARPRPWLSLVGLAAISTVVVILVAYWNCFEVYWDLIWHCPVLACELALMLGMALGFVLPGYGLTNLFWGDGYEPGGAVVVPVLSSSMIVLSTAVFLLCGY